LLHKQTTFLEDEIDNDGENTPIKETFYHVTTTKSFLALNLDIKATATLQINGYIVD